MKRAWLAIVCVSWCSAGCGSTDAKGHCLPAPGTVCTITGDDNAGVAGDDGPAVEAELYLPMDMTPGPDGKLYLLDWNNHRIRAIDKQGVIRTVAGSGFIGDGPPGPALKARFNHPTNMTFDKQGRMIIAAWHNSRVERFDPHTGVIEDIAGTGLRAYTGDGGPADKAVLDLPAGVTLDKDDNLYIMDQANQTIRRVDQDGTINRFAGRCIIGTCPAGTTPRACMGIDKLTCIAESDPDACKKPCSAAFDGDGGPALMARFAQQVGQAADPAGRLAFDDHGNLFMADSGNHRIRKIAADGTVSTVAGNGDAGYSGDGGPATEASLDNPVDVAIDHDGTLYIADTYNSCIRRVSAKGKIDTFAGQCGKRGFSGDGAAPTAALFDRPYGVALNAEGDLYVADTHNNRLRVIQH